MRPRLQGDQYAEGAPRNTICRARVPRILCRGTRSTCRRRDPHQDLWEVGTDTRTAPHRPCALEFRLNAQIVRGRQSSSQRRGLSLAGFPDAAKFLRFDAVCWPHQELLGIPEPVEEAGVMLVELLDLTFAPRQPPSGLDGNALAVSPSVEQIPEAHMEALEHLVAEPAGHDQVVGVVAGSARSTSRNNVVDGDLMLSQRNPAVVADRAVSRQHLPADIKRRVIRHFRLAVAAPIALVARGVAKPRGGTLRLENDPAPLADHLTGRETLGGLRLALAPMISLLDRAQVAVGVTFYPTPAVVGTLISPALVGAKLSGAGCEKAFSAKLAGSNGMFRMHASKSSMAPPLLAAPMKHTSMPRRCTSPAAVAGRCAAGSGS